MNIIGIIPARYASTRFPGKPLVNIQGKSMIQRVYEQSRQAKCLKDVVVATDDDRIEAEVKRFGGNVVMTGKHHLSGTERCFEAMCKFSSKANVIVNIQGDEPFIKPEQIELVCACFENKSTQIATLVKKITNSQELFNANIPKVIFNDKKQAIYFSREAIPHIRGKNKNEWLEHHTFYKHIGIYAYQAEVLEEIVKMKPNLLETVESLEQLRWLVNKIVINIEITDFESIAIDMPDDLNRLPK